MIPDLIEAVILMSGRNSGLFIGTITTLFMVTLFCNMISLSPGINNTTCYAAEQGDMPAAFKLHWHKNQMSIGAAIICVLCTVMRLVSPECELFRTFFALNMVLLRRSPVFRS